MSGATMPEGMSTKLRKVAERARREPEGRFVLAHLLDVESLRRAFGRLRGNAAVGIDGVSKAQYAEGLDEKLEELHERLRSRRWRHQPIRRVEIPKGKGKSRPLGISCLEDKIVQAALSELLGAVYEQDFLPCSYGFRPGRSAHDAVRALNQAIHREEVKYVLEADIESFFDSIDRKMLLEMLQVRVPDGSIKRLVGKCLHVGVLEGERFTRPEVGTAQGSVLSPLLGNLYLHYALDKWFEEQIKPRLRGRAVLIRYCDDFVIGFELLDDAMRVEEVLPKRMARFGLRLHPQKTALLDLRRPPAGQQGGKGQDTLDFLGFTFYWRRSRRGRWVLGCKTQAKRLRTAIVRVGQWCRRHRHLPVAQQHRALVSRLQGHCNYFGVNGNMRSLRLLIREAEDLWFKWLCRRSQRSRLTWDRYTDLLRDFPLPRTRVVVQLWS